jgi:xanthine dehydrogenase YagR molybdenum-binding subunit
MLFVTKKACDNGQAAQANQAAVEGDGYMQPGKERERYAFQSWGAPCVEVKSDPEVARVTVSRVVSAFVVSAFDVGRIIHRKTAQCQGIIMGVGMALMGTPYMTIATAASSPVTWL